MSFEVETNPYLGLVVCTLWGLVWVEERQTALDGRCRKWKTVARIASWST